MERKSDTPRPFPNAFAPALGLDAPALIAYTTLSRKDPPPPERPQATQ